MFLDFHTHTVPKEADVRGIYNVILHAADRENEPWRSYGMVSVGIHPWYIPEKGWEELLPLLEEAAALPVVKCIGEAGLDRLRGPGMQVQEEVFRAQIRVASKVNKPVVVHCVRAFDELTAIKKTVRVPLVIHGFNRKAGLLRQLVSAGFYVSFGKDILDKPHVQEALRETPADRLFLETDDCTTVSIREIYEQAAALRGITLEELQEKTNQNYSTL